VFICAFLGSSIPFELCSSFKFFGKRVMKHVIPILRW
jgi:hypothetical protein